MEIERKYLIEEERIPFCPGDYPCRHIEQGYLCTEPVVRIRRDNHDFFLTYKSKGLMMREEYNLPLTEEAYEHLKCKVDGRLITKDRYVIPLSEGAGTENCILPKACTHTGTYAQPGNNKELFIELDFFRGDFDGLILAEVEFPDEESANTFKPPAWFGEDVTASSRYHNSTMSQK